MASDRRLRTTVLTIGLIAALVTPAAHGRSRGVLLGETVAVNTHYGAPRDPVDPAALARLAAAGVRWVRNDLEGRILALWSERPSIWHLRARRPGARVLARDGRDVTPPGLRRGALLTLATDDGPVYVLGTVAVRPAATTSRIGGGRGSVVRADAPGSDD